MKKIIVIFGAMAISLGAMAITEDEIVAQFDAGVTAGSPTWKVSKAIVAENDAEIAPLFSAWKSKEISHFSRNTPIPTVFAALSEAEGIKQDKLRQVYANYFIEHQSEYADFNYRGKILTGAKAVFDNLAADNPNFYTELKAANFVVEAVRLPHWCISSLVDWADDNSFYENLSVADGVAYNGYIPAMCKILIQMEDVEAAKIKCRAIENYFLERQIFDSPLLMRIQSVNKVLTSRLVDAKIIGK